MSKVYGYITDAILGRLEKGTVPWHKPWKNGASGAPANLVSRKAYRGVNVFLLTMQGYRSPYWLTFCQARERGGEVRRGEKSTPVVYWNWFEKKLETPDGERIQRIPFLRYYRVFNTDQCEGLPVPDSQEPKRPFVPIEEAERRAAGYPDSPEVRHQGGQAFYRPSTDLIVMPDRSRFDSPEEYYSTLFHEMTHSTGHQKRLARKTLMDLCPFGSTNYSKEELVAEMGAAILCGESGIENRTIDNSAAYIQGWLSRLRDDRKLVVGAAAQAQKAADLILDRSVTDENKDDPSPPQEEVA